MNATCALCKSLLAGHVVSIKTGFTDFGITNVPREIGRSIERKFGVIVTRTQKEGFSRYGQPSVWVDYHLEHTPTNASGIASMFKYVLSHEPQPPSGYRTDASRREANHKPPKQHPAANYRQGLLL